MLLLLLLPLRRPPRPLHGPIPRILLPLRRRRHGIPNITVPAVGDVIVGDVLPLGAGLEVFVVGGGRVRVLGDYVPGVQHAGEVADHAEEDVDEGVEGAEAGFDPYCGRDGGVSWSGGWSGGG